MNPQKIKMEDSTMNRENKRKQYEKGYYKTHPCNETFVCKNCGRTVQTIRAMISMVTSCPFWSYMLMLNQETESPIAVVIWNQYQYG